VILRRAFIVLLLVSLFLKGCAERRVETDEIIPDSADCLVKLRYQEVRSDPFLSSFVDLKQIEEIFKGISINPQEVHELVILSDLKEMFGMIVRGNLDPRGIKDKLKEEGALEERYEGDKLFRSPEGEIFLTFISRDILIFGSRSCIESVWDARRKRAKSWAEDEELMDLKGELSSSPLPMRMYLKVPQQLMDALGVSIEGAKGVLNLIDLKPFAELISLVGRIAMVEGVGAAIGRRGDKIRLQALYVMADEKMASIISGIVALAEGLTHVIPREGMGEEDIEAINMLRNVEMERRGRLLSITWELDVQASQENP